MPLYMRGVPPEALWINMGKPSKPAGTVIFPGPLPKGTCRHMQDCAERHSVPELQARLRRATGRLLVTTLRHIPIWQKRSCFLAKNSNGPDRSEPRCIRLKITVSSGLFSAIELLSFKDGNTAW